jgi:hypothetical protein
VRGERVQEKRVGERNTEKIKEWGRRHLVVGQFLEGKTDKAKT